MSCDAMAVATSDGRSADVMTPETWVVLSNRLAGLHQGTTGVSHRRMSETGPTQLIKAA